MPAGVVPEPEGQVAPAGEDGGGTIGPQRLRALDDDRFAGPDAGLQPCAARRPVAIAAAPVRAARFPVASADRLPELPDAARRAQPVVVHQVAAVAATDDRRRRRIAPHFGRAVVVLRPIARRRRHHRRRRGPQDLVHSGAQAQGQGTRRVHHQRHANGLGRPERPGLPRPNRLARLNAPPVHRFIAFRLCIYMLPCTNSSLRGSTKRRRKI